ncbi:MAG: hypothetical protein Q9163_002600 [Psora crenata]
MLDTLCTYPLTSDLFAQATQATSPLIAIGLASGHVQLNRLSDSSGIKTGYGTIETAWRTRRHKGSCRTLAFNNEGSHLFSAGTDGVVKIADTETGRVVSKIAVPLRNGQIDPPTLLQPLSPQTLLLSTDSGPLHIYDLASPSNPSSRPAQTHRALHADYITSLTPLPPTETSTSGFSKQWLSTGGTTVAITDLRKGLLVHSEEQDGELLSSAIVGGKVVVGDDKGVLKFWDVGVWNDSEITIRLGKEARANVISTAPEGVSKEPMVAVGCDDGKVRFVGVGGKRPKKLGNCTHDEVEGVAGLGWCGEKLISGGGAVVKFWNGGGNKEIRSEGTNEEGEEEADLDEKRKKKKKKRGKAKGSGGGSGILAFKGMD